MNICNCLKQHDTLLYTVCILSPFYLQSNEVGGSYHMEREGLVRGLRFLEQHDVTTSVLVTDRHPGIRKWIRENRSSCLHLYDVWHVAKGKVITHMM